MIRALHLFFLLGITACGPADYGCSDPHGIQCIFSLYSKLVPSSYEGELSILAVERDGLSNDASRFVSVLNDCQKVGCWFAIDASDGRYFSDVMQEAKRLERVLLLGSIDEANAVIIVRREDQTLYRAAAEDFGLSAKIVINRYVAGEDT